MQIECTSRPARCHQQSDADESDEHSDAAVEIDAISILAGALENRRPERSGGNEKRREAAGHPLLSPDHRKIADAHHEQADEEQFAQQTLPARHRLSSKPRDGEENEAGDDESCARQ